MKALKTVVPAWRWAGLASAAAIAVALAFPVAAQKSEAFLAGEKAYHRGDVRGAIAKLKPAADRGEADSQALLGEILDYAENNDEAVAYFRKSADQGNVDGAFGLGRMMAIGEGTPKDPAGARVWMIRAAEGGHEAALRTVVLAYAEGGLGLSAEQRASPEALNWIRKGVDEKMPKAMLRLAKAYRNGEFGLAVNVKEAEALEARIRALSGAKPQKGKQDANKPK
ncbi:MAG TPA: tetratricopeptide repeat protein [Usitatibacteraceae bacterium]|nr:tetratricopeptide repeat protein [Usitatibacteraceae bacterium]